MRAKRGSLQLGAMIWCEVGRNPFDYNLYGCWCGVGGKGQPVDEIDRYLKGDLSYHSIESGLRCPFAKCCNVIELV